MRRRRIGWAGPLVVVATAALLLMPSLAHAEVVARNFATPLFGLFGQEDGLLVADAGEGIKRIRDHGVRLVAALPGVTDAAPSSRGIYAVTGEPDAKLYRINDGHPQVVRDLGAFEARVNPDGGEIHSNPFDVAVQTGRRVLVADAGANALLRVGIGGRVEVVATFPEELVQTANAKRIAGCDGGAGPAEICDLPGRIPAQPVTTSVAIGPDGAFYVGELKGFPAPRRQSRIWRVEPDARAVDCGTSPACTVVGDGFTSIIDLSIGTDGSLLVTELDEASWLAMEEGVGVGGSINRCQLVGSSLECSVLARKSMPTATVENRFGVFTTVDSLLPTARVVSID